MPSSQLCLLSLDGGGVRGLSSLQILKQLMETINPESPPKPCEYFDMIGGTSTGGLLAILLGRLQMSIDDCTNAYISLSDKIFQKRRHRVNVKGQVQGRFDSDELERAVKEIVVKQGLGEDALLKDSPDAKCKVFVCATSQETGDTVHLTSYRSPRGREHLLRKTKIWEAGRATSAASSFFDPIAIGDYGEVFVDGATGANNPVGEVWNEAKDMWPHEPFEDNIKCLVSIGTGVPTLKPFGSNLLEIGQTLLDIATETEKTAERFARDKERLGDEGRYFRFNVLRGLEDIGLEDSKQKNAIVAATSRYVAFQAVFKQMKACGNNLAEREYFRPYLHRAAEEGDEVKLRKLLQNRVTDINAKDSDGKTSLHHAAAAGHETIVRMLLRNEAKIESEDFTGRTALHYASTEGHGAVVKELLRRGANIEIEDNDGKTPLHCAVENDQVVVVIQLLLENTPSIQTKRRRMAAVCTLQTKHEAVAWLLKYGLEMEAIDCNGDTMLHWAATRGLTTVVQLLLEKGIDVDSKNIHGETALRSAANHGHEAVVRLLLDNGADVNARGRRGQIALHAAAHSGNVAVVRLLQEKDTDVNTKDDNGKTALLFAAAKGHEAVVQLLLRERGIDVNAKADGGGATALQMAAQLGHEAAVQLLLEEKSIDINTRTEDGRTPLHFAALLGRDSVVRLLVARGAKIKAGNLEGFGTALCQAAATGHETVVRSLLEKGASATEQSQDHNTVLHYAAGAGHEAIVRLLIEKGAKVDAKTDQSITPLHLAAVHGFVSVIRLLIQKGASIKAKNKHGATALVMAKLNKHEGAMRLLK